MSRTITGLKYSKKSGTLPTKPSRKIRVTEVVSVGFIPFGSRANSRVKKGLPLARSDSEVLRRIADYLEAGTPRAEKQRRFLFFKEEGVNSLWRPYPSTVKVLERLERDIRKVGTSRAVKRAYFQVTQLMQVVAKLHVNELYPASWGLSIGGRTGGKKRAVNQTRLKDRRNAKIWKEWCSFAKSEESRGHRPTVEIFWPSTAQALSDRLKRSDPEAGNSLRGKGEDGFLTINAAREIIKKIRRSLLLKKN